MRLFIIFLMLLPVNCFAVGVCKNCTVNGTTSACIYTFVSFASVQASQTNYTQPGLFSDAYGISGGFEIVPRTQNPTSYKQVYYKIYKYWNGTKWVQGSMAPATVYHNNSSGLVSEPTLEESFPNGIDPLECPVPTICDTADFDGDGVCNECDQAPGQPDADDCLLIESVDKNTGQLVGVVINRQCDGQTHEFWQSDNYNPVTARSWANIGSSADKLGKQNCQVGLPDGQCCAYSSGSAGETYTASLSPQSAVPATKQQILDSLLDLPSIDDVPETCANHNATCKEYCEDKLGVALSYCREDSAGKKVSKCQCSNDFAYEMASPDESTQEKVDQVDQAINKDSNANGVPDYADAGTQNKADTDSDGIHDQADVDQTGGIDANGDGIDDKATAEAHANAVASSGLSEADSRNLDAIEQSTAQTASGVEGVKNAMDQVVSKADDLLEAADSALAESQAIRDHLDTFTEENTGSLSTIEQTLNDGPFSGISEGDIPDDPTTEENFDVDSFVQEFSFAFPDEMKDLIEDSKIETTSSDSCIRGTVMGQQIEFCFNQFHSIFVAMGVLFQGLCVFRAFGIVVGGFGR